MKKPVDKNEDDSGEDISGDDNITVENAEEKNSEEKKIFTHFNETGPNKGKPECRIIVHNISKKNNIGMIIRSAVAFGVSQIIVVGAKKIGMHGNQGTIKYMRFEHFGTMSEARDYLKEGGFTIVGVEIGERAEDVTTHPFTHGNTAFIFGNEGTGIHENVLKLCDKLVYIPQYCPGTASLNVSNAASIVLHEFAKYAQYTPNTFEGQKFVVDETKHVERFVFESSLSHQKLVEERKRKREETGPSTNGGRSSTTVNTSTTSTPSTTLPKA